jgi:hypothetical protein
LPATAPVLPLFGGRLHVYCPVEFRKQRPRPAPPTTRRHLNSYPEQKNYMAKYHFKKPIGKKINRVIINKFLKKWFIS